MPRGFHNWAFQDVARFLKKNQFRLSHIEGSHYYYVGVYQEHVRQVTVPFHAAKAIHPKTMRSIVRQSGIPVHAWLQRKS